MLENLALNQLKKKMRNEGFEFVAAWIDPETDELKFQFSEKPCVIIPKDEHEAQKLYISNLLKSVAQ